MHAQEVHGRNLAAARRQADPLVATLMPSCAAPAYLGTQVEIIQSERLAGPRRHACWAWPKSPAAVDAVARRPPRPGADRDLLRLAAAQGLSVEPGRGTRPHRHLLHRLRPAVRRGGCQRVRPCLHRVQRRAAHRARRASTAASSTSASRACAPSSKTRSASVVDLPARAACIIPTERYRPRESRLTSLEAASPRAGRAGRHQQPPAQHRHRDFGRRAAERGRPRR